MIILLVVLGAGLACVAVVLRNEIGFREDWLALRNGRPLETRLRKRLLRALRG